MNITPELQKQKDEEFKLFVKELKAYLKENPHHQGSIAKTSELGAKLYRFAYIRRGKGASKVYSEKHFAMLDKVLPDWDNYKITRFDFDKFSRHLQKFVDEKNKMYDEMGVPTVLRDLHVPEKQMVGTYYLGNKISRMKMGMLSVNKEEKKIIETICPDCFKTPLKFSIATFYINLKKFVEEKDKEYDKLGVSHYMRDYRVHYNDMVGDYPIGSRKRYFLNNWNSLNEAQKNCFLEIAPNFFEVKTKQGFDFNKFFMEYVNFIAKKNQYYDKLETPKELRTYSLERQDRINGYPLGEQFYYVKTSYKANANQIAALDKLNPNWREKPTKFDFGELYGQYLQFKKQRDAHYNKHNVPQEKRGYTVFSSTYMGNYELGANMYLIRSGKLKLTDKEKEYLLKLDPNCLDLANAKAKTVKRKKTVEQERV